MVYLTGFSLEGWRTSDNSLSCMDKHNIVVHVVTWSL